MYNQIVLIIGEVFVDTHLDILDCDKTPMVRMGGIFHAARACSALGINYALAYFAPGYLDNDVNLWSLNLMAKGCYKLGEINQSPNVMLIRESTESGEQGYINVLKDQAKYTNDNSLEKIIETVNPTDILLFPGRYDKIKVFECLNKYSGKLHIDIHYDSEDIIKIIKRRIDSLILSTSSSIFIKECHGKYSEFFKLFERYNIEKFLFKENRGGSVCYIPRSKEKIESDAYYVPTMHSVGVGDVYNAVFISDLYDDDIAKKMKLSALCASKYAETMNYEKFKKNVELFRKNIDNLKEIIGIRAPWETRNKINIYLAAPDFPDVNTDFIDQLYNNLLYHNFSPRRPIKENGLANNELSENEKLEMYNKDLMLLEECDLLIAILLYNDPGTLVELGIFKQSGKPTIVFDPFNYCTNMFVRHTPNYLCHTISDVIDATYLCLGGKSI